MPIRITAMISRGAATLAGLILVVITAYTLIEITLRGTVGTASNVLVEFVGYGLASMTFLGAAQTLRDGGLVRVSLVLRFVPTFIRRGLDALSCLCGIGVVSMTAWFVIADMQRSFSRGYETDSLVPLPLWVPPLGLLMGMIAFVLEMVSWLWLTAAAKKQLPENAPETT